MTKKEIHDFIMEGIEGARIISEMRKDGTLPPYSSDNSTARFFQEEAELEFRRRMERLNRHSVQSTNNITENTGKDTSALGFQVRAAMYNAGNSGQPYHPPMTNGAMANFDMDLKDQAGVPYNIASPWEEL